MCDTLGHLIIEGSMLFLATLTLFEIVGALVLLALLGVGAALDRRDEPTFKWVMLLIIPITIFAYYKWLVGSFPFSGYEIWSKQTLIFALQYIGIGLGYALLEIQGRNV